ncbi:MAG: TolC family protein [Terriglobia bacterium]
MLNRRGYGLAVAGAILAVGFGTLNGMAQQPPNTPKNQNSNNTQGSSLYETTYTRTGIFPNILEPYLNPRVPPMKLENSGLIYELIQNGKMQLSLQDAVALALENNLDIDLSRYNTAYAKIDQVRAASGQASRGINGAFSSSALFSGAIGGGINTSSAGGGSGGAGSATGGGGRAFNIGPIGSFDPVVGFEAGWNDSVTPLGTNIVTGVNSLVQHTTTYNGFLGQEFPTGTSYAVSLFGGRQSTNQLTAFFNPQLSSGLTVAVNQHLLNGFGYRANAKFIRIADNDLQISKSVFRQQVITTLTTVLGDYWNLATTHENVRVAQEAVNYAQRLLQDNKRQVQIGTLAPIDVVQAESQLATAQTNLVVAQTNYLEAQSTIKTALSKRVDATLSSVEVVPTDKLPEPKSDDVPPLEQSLQLALKNRPEVETDELNLKYESIVLKANRNSLLPTLDVFAAYQPSGLGGDTVIYGKPKMIGNNLVPNPIGAIPGAYTGLFTQMFQNDYPNYSVGFTLQVPIRNRAAQADSARALLEQRSLQTTLQQEINTVEQDVRNAEIAVTQAKAQIQSAKKAVDYAQQTLDAEQKKFKLGESTVTLVIQQQNNLTTAEGTLVTAYSTYAKALTQYEQATGTTLTANNVQINEALTGRVPQGQTPNIPGSQDFDQNHNH